MEGHWSNLDGWRGSTGNRRGNPPHRRLRAGTRGGNCEVLPRARVCPDPAV
jgi:hypothetical protein